VNLIEVEAKDFVLNIGHLGRREPVVQPTISRMKEVELKRMISLLAAMALMAAMVAANAMPAFAKSPNSATGSKGTGNAGDSQGEAGPGQVKKAPPPQVDTDRDGVPDEFDLCPTIAGIQPSGCPPGDDTDGDGIPDIGDACPTVFATSVDGCPRDTV
jgi:hypothetical protein